MRGQTLILLLATIAFSGFAQIPDTLSPEKKVRWKIERMRKEKQALVSEDFQSTLNSITDMASKRIPFITQKELRRGIADTATVVYVNEGLRSGTFRYDPNSKSPDDSSMVIISGKRRYLRDDGGCLRPEWFGANPNDENDDADAIQKMMNAVPVTGAILKFANGVYYVGKQVNYKAVSKAPKWYFKVIMEGAGVGRTQIFGKVGFAGDMFVINTGAPSGQAKDNYITIQNIEFRANTARRILYGTEIVSLKIYDCMFMGGEDCGIEIGAEATKVPGGYSVYMKNNYHNGQAYGAGQVNALLRLNNCRFFVIDGMESDGGKYSVEMLGPCDKNIFVNCKLEGAKRAAIYSNNLTGGGGENQILNSTLNPYVGIESKALFDGESNCIEIISKAGGNAFNTIRGNLLLCNSLDLLPFIGKVTNSFGKFIAAPDINTHGVVGSSSGAVGYLAGFDQKSSKIIIQVTSGKFTVGETVKQRTTNATAVISALIPKHSHAIKLTGGGGTNIISNNRIRQLPEYGIYNESNDNIITGNAIEALNGVYSTTQSGVIVSDNSFYSPGGTAVTRVNGVLNYSNNRVLIGKLSGVSELYLSSDGGMIKGDIFVEGKSNLKGAITAPSLPEYSNNEAAKAAGLENGALYRTATGEVRVKY
jgi:hypothetical protein